jgi:hypothetical protein
VITYRATLDVLADTVAQVSRWLAAHRKANDRAPWQRAATPYVQAVMVLRWFKERTDMRGAGPRRRGVDRDGLPVPARGHRRDRCPSTGPHRRVGPRPGAGLGVRVSGRHPDRLHPIVCALRGRP